MKLAGFLLLGGASLAVAIILHPTERERICRPGYAQSQRFHFEDYARMRDAAFQRAGIPVSKQCTTEEYVNDYDAGCYVVDHIIPLEIGGSNDLANIQIQPKSEAKSKDLIENRARKDYCAGRIGLSTAQGYFTRTRN